jgi:hypothetical protein
VHGAGAWRNYVEFSQKQDGTSFDVKLILPELPCLRWQPTRYNVFSMVSRVFRVSSLQMRIFAIAGHALLQTIQSMYAAAQEWDASICTAL